MNHLIDKTVKYDECSTPEPTLRELVHQYYLRYFDKRRAMEYTRRYLQQLDPTIDMPQDI